MGRYLLTYSLIVALVGLLVFALAPTRQDPAARGDGVTITGVLPRFNPNQEHYVSRCGRGGDPIAIDAPRGSTVELDGVPLSPGIHRLDVPAASGERIEVTITRSAQRRIYGVRCLPTNFPDWRFEAIRPTGSGLFVVSFVDPDTGEPWVIVFDQRGTPRWWYSPDTRALWGQILADGRVTWARSFGDGYGLDRRMAHEVRSESGRLLDLVRTKGSIVDGHEFRELANRRVLLATYVPEVANLRRFDGPRRAAIVSAEIQELDPAGRVRWRWNSGGHIALAETGRWWRNVLSNERLRLGGRPTFDPVHINSIEPRGRNEVVISTRHTDAIYGIDRPSGEINWKLGGTPTADSLTVVGDPARKLFGGQHDVRVEGNRLTVYDNGKDRPRRPRVAFYRLDLSHGRAIYRRQLNDEQVTSSHCCGSARQLPNGGWLVSWGDNPLVSGFDTRGRLGFRLHLPASTFRAVPVPQGATTIGRLDRAMDNMSSADHGRINRPSRGEVDIRQDAGLVPGGG